MKILVLAGGADQCALIKELAKRGHEVILLDYLPNPPAKSLVIKHIQESTLDADSVKRVAISENVDLICTACTDQALLTVAKVSEELNLPCYISYSDALNVTNKSYMKRRMIEGNITTSSYTIIRNKEDIDVIKSLKFPLVVKPADCNSSKGVIKVFTQEEGKDIINQALELSRTKTAIVEEFVEGNEISADFYIEGQTPRLLGASYSLKIPDSSGFTIIGSLYQPITTTIKSKLLAVAKQISDVFELQNTPLLIQLIDHNGEYSVIEFSARMGGGSKYRLIQEMSGVDIMEKYVDLILGTKPVMHEQLSTRFIKILYVYTYPGIISKISGLDRLEEDGIITDCFQYKTIGSIVEHAKTSSDRSLGIMLSADSEEELARKIALVDRTIRIEDDKGVDIVRHDLIS